jgi:Predicted transcriptional regulators
MTTIGKRLRQLRETNGLSGEEFGEIMGVTKAMVSQWESDHGKPGTKRLLMLSEKNRIFFLYWLLRGESVYSTRDPKLAAILRVMEPQAEYVKDAAVSAVLTTVELADRAKSNGTHG